MYLSPKVIEVDEEFGGGSFSMLPGVTYAYTNKATQEAFMTGDVLEIDGEDHCFLAWLIYPSEGLSFH